jgi:putative oxidoreductase
MNAVLKTTLRMHTPSAIQDMVLLLARVGLGGVLIAHGWQKLDEQGLSGTAAGFDGMGIPFPELAAHYSTWVELVGGGLLVAGFLTPLVAVLVIGDMAGAFWYAHRDAGVFVAEGGWELVAMIGLLALTLVAVGAGRLSIDGFIAGGKRHEDLARSERETVNA